MTGTHPHLVHDGARDDESTIRVGERVSALGDGYTVFLGSLVLVDDVVLGADENTRGSIKLLRRARLSSRYCTYHDMSVEPCIEVEGRTLNEQVRSRVSRLAPLSNDVIQSQIELVVRQHLYPHLVSYRVTLYNGSTHLLCGVECLASRILICVSVIHLERSKQRVLESDVDTDHGVDDGSLLVRLERGGDGEVCSSVLLIQSSAPPLGSQVSMRLTLLRMYTSLAFSIAPIMTARPLGSVAMY